MNKKQLPLFIDPTILPTNKYHVSYSENADWLECSYRHKLKHIDKLGEFNGSIHTEFGNAMHDTLEKFIIGELVINEESIRKTEIDFRDRCAELNKTGADIKDSDIEDFVLSIPDILTQVPKFLDAEYPGWTGFAGELPLFEPIAGQTNTHFKGFIDTVIQVPRKLKKTAAKTTPAPQSGVMRMSDLKAGADSDEESEVESHEKISMLGEKFDYILLDWKTTSWGWDAGKKRDYNKQLQLMYYKHFFCQKFNLNLDRVKCAFLLLKRTPRKNDDSRCELVKVSVGPKTQAKAVGTLHTMINSVKARRAVKNRASCRFCDFNNSPHCT